LRQFDVTMFIHNGNRLIFQAVFQATVAETSETVKKLISLIDM